MKKSRLLESQSKHSDNALIIFVKNPELGKVKTRLAASVGEKKALEVYLKLLFITCNVSKLVSGVRYLFYSSEIIQNDIWGNQLFEKKIQNGNDLGTRMSNAFNETLNFHKKAVIIGSDCPELRPELINSAFVALNDFDFVLGPSLDGGYYLIGMKQFEKTIFQDIAWSTESVYVQTIQKIEGLGKTIFELPMLSDLDDIKDFDKFKHLLDQD